MSKNPSVILLGIAVAGLAATAMYWRTRALRLEEMVTSGQGQVALAPKRQAAASAQAPEAVSNLPKGPPGRVGHEKKPRWKRALGEKLRREEGIERASDEELERAWEVLVSRALDEEIARRMRERRVSDADRRRLLEQLRRIRDVNEVAFGDGENADVRSRMVRTVALLQADRIFRDVLGVGASEVIAGLGGKAQVQDVSTQRVPPDDLR